MPCRDYEYNPSTHREDTLREKNDKLSRMLCNLIRYTALEVYGSELIELLQEADTSNDGLADWWRQHESADAGEILRKLSAEDVATLERYFQNNQ